MNNFFTTTAFNRFYKLGLGFVSTVSFAALFAVLPAYAQATQEAMPSSWELGAPSTQANTQTTNENDAENIAASQPAVPSRVSARAAQDPCPEPKQAKSNRPDDLAKVQEDIDRFALCVQRAQLLERLNESAERAAQTVDSALGLTMPAPSAALPTGGMSGGGAMPPLPAAMMGGFDVSPAAQNMLGGMSGGGTQASEQISTNVDVSVEVTETTEEPAKPSWTIREIFGSVTDMQARLLSPEGSEMLARQGTRLTDGSVVTTITPSGVTLRTDGKVTSLEWSRN